MWWNRIKTKWPFLVWIAAVVLTLYLYSVGVSLEAFVGHVEAIDLPVAPVEDSRVETVFVALGDPVTNNQPVAQMDSSIIDAEIAVNDALAAENTALATDRILSLYGGYQKAVSDAEAQLHAETVAQGEAQGELKATSAELARLRKLIDDRVMTVDNTVISRLITQEASLNEAVRLYPASIRSVEERLAKAKTEFESFKKWLGIGSTSEVTEALIEKVRQTVGSPIQQIALLRQRKEKYTLRTSYPGIVAHLFERPGNVIARGVPVATVLVASDRVIGFLPEIFAKEPTIGMSALILRRSGQSMDPIPAVVEAMSPRIEPTTVTSPTGQSLRGRRIYLRMTRKADLLPGETVDIQLLARSNPWIHSLKQIGASIQSVFSRSSRPVDETK